MQDVLTRLYASDALLSSLIINVKQPAYLPVPDSETLPSVFVSQRDEGTDDAPRNYFQLRDDGTKQWLPDDFSFDTKLASGRVARTSIPVAESRYLAFRRPSTVRGAVLKFDDAKPANLDNVQLVPVSCLLRRAGLVAPERWPEFCSAMSKVMAC